MKNSYEHPWLKIRRNWIRKTSLNIVGHVENKHKLQRDLKANNLKLAYFVRQPQRNYNDIKVLVDNFGLDEASEKNSAAEFDIISERSQFEETARQMSFDSR